MDYYQFKIQADPAKSQILLALLAEFPFDAFEESDESLKAYIPAKYYSSDLESEVSALANKFDCPYSVAFLESKNWNEIWESEFKPVIIDDFCIIRASFHDHQTGFEHEIIIDPKMAFGTGHHATTTLMIRMMRNLEFKGKTVLDFGAGTGILAILASRMGAAGIVANEIEDAAFENIKQNLDLNVIENVDPVHGSLESVKSHKFDIILANINRNTLLEYLPALYNKTSENGKIILSGFYEKDESRMTEKAKVCGFSPGRRLEKDRWVCLEFLK